MKAPRAWVAQLGQRRSVEVAVPKGFAGSNPAPRIHLATRWRGSRGPEVRSEVNHIQIAVFEAMLSRLN